MFCRPAKSLNQYVIEAQVDVDRLFYSWCIEWQLKTSICSRSDVGCVEAWHAQQRLNQSAPIWYYTHYGHNKWICCFLVPPVHWSLKKVGWKILQNRIFFYINNSSKIFAFSCNFVPVFLFLFLPLDPLNMPKRNGPGKDLRNNTLIN